MRNHASLAWIVAIQCSLLATTTAQTRWSEATPSLPFSNSTCVAAFDTTLGRTVVVEPGATWAIVSATGVVTQLTGPTPGGSAWNDAAIAYDPVRQQVVLFGGYDFNGSARATTLQLVAGVWQQPTAPGSPPARHSAGMCFDAAAGVIRLAAGDAANFGAAVQPLADVWTFDGTTWTQAPATPNGPAGPTEMAFDTVRGRCVAWAANGTFEWIGGGFVPVPTNSSPPPRRGAAFVYDAFRERIVLHGGFNFGTTTRSDVWEYDGSDWQQRQPLGLFARRQWHGTVYDPTARLVRAFAGIQTTYTLGGQIVSTFVFNSELHYEPVSPPLALYFAQGCYFNATLLPGGLPWLGDTFTLSMPVAGPIPPLMVFGASNEQFGAVPLPLPIAFLGFPNCELVASPDVVLPTTVSGASASVSFPIPNQPQLLGVRLYVQGFEPDLAGNGTGTNGLLMQVGGR
jgi:hypothetical protein